MRSPEVITDISSALAAGSPSDWRFHASRVPAASDPWTAPTMTGQGAIKPWHLAADREPLRVRGSPTAYA